MLDYHEDDPVYCTDFSCKVTQTVSWYSGIRTKYNLFSQLVHRNTLLLHNKKLECL